MFKMSTTCRAIALVMPNAQVKQRIADVQLQIKNVQENYSSQDEGHFKTPESDRQAIQMLQLAKKMRAVLRVEHNKGKIDPQGFAQEDRRLELMQRLPSVFFAAFSDRLEEAAGDDRHLVRSIIERSQAFVRQCLVEAQEQGHISRALSPDVLATVVIGTLQANAFLHHRLGGKSPYDPHSVWQVLENLMTSTV